MTQFTNADNKEIDKFDKVSQLWWDPKGEMGTLHTINPLRTQFVLEQLDGKGPRILDVGCGGGILSEALARAGAQVLGIDLSQPSLEVARRHASAQGLGIEYQRESVEEIARKNAGSFDAVTCMEMLEHVPDPQKIVAACAQALRNPDPASGRPGGQVFFSTIDRTPKAFLFAIIGGEYILRLLPRGTHTYKKLISPSELKQWAAQAGLEFVRLSSLIYNPFTGAFKVAADKEDMNYMAHFIKR